MSGSLERYGGDERDLSVLRDQFVRQYLGDGASDEQVAQALGLLLKWEHELQKQGKLELND